jgi:hypothetical protein
MNRPAKILSHEVIAQIAEAHGFDAADHEVVESVAQAEENHGKDCGKVYWATDSYGRYDAEHLLDGYLSQCASDARAEAGRANQFSRDAYGY